MRQQEFLILAGVEQQWTFLAKTLDGSSYLGCFNDANGQYYYGNSLQSADQFKTPEGGETQIASLDFGYWESSVKIIVNLDEFIEDAQGNKYFQIIEMSHTGAKHPTRRP